MRSPAEFAAGHIPGAANVPLFSDDERAEIGTLYADLGHDAAVVRGHGIVDPRKGSLVSQATAIAEQFCSGADGNANKEIFVHCWRGGLRSQSVAELLESSGLLPTVLTGGYKQFRTLARASIVGRWKLMVVSGLTGAGKTRFLHLLQAAGEQVCDLEGLANHRGSAYGGIGQGDQPSTEQFENDLFACLNAHDPNQRIWVEDEGNRIGRVIVPQEFYEGLRHAPAVFLDVDMLQRVQNLLVDYQDLPAEHLLTATGKIRKGLGGKLADQALAAIEQGNIALAVEITLDYYDRTYLKAAAKMPRELMQQLPTSGLTDPQVVQQCIEIADGSTVGQV